MKNENILCICNTTWDGPYTKSVVQLTSLLALNNRVLFVEYPFTIKDMLFTWLGKQHAPVGRMLGLKKRFELKITKEGAKVFTWIIPPIIPVNAIQNKRIFEMVLKIDSFIYRCSLKKALKKLHMTEPVLINAYNPVFGESLIGKVGQKADIYYCYDGFLTDRRGIKAWQADREYSKIADGIIVTSDYLKDQKMQFNKKVATVKNGVDFNVFNLKAKTNINPTTNRRKIGYIGSIDQRFDIETVVFAVENLPDCDFEFIGDVRNAEVKSVLEQYSNVRFLPPIKPNEVPERLNKCDVGIIPYLCTEINKNVYPLKINEYLAVGVPVVITRFADLPEFSEFVSCASNKEEFRNSLVEVLKNDNSAQIKRRIEFARSNSWESRAELFSNEVSSFLTMKLSGQKQN